MKFEFHENLVKDDFFYFLKFRSVDKIKSLL